MTIEAAAGTSLWSTFTAKAELLGAAVMRTSSQEGAIELLQEAAGEFTCIASVASRFPVVSAAAGSPGTADEVVAPGELAVAETGSVVLNEPPEDRGRCLLSERLWLLVSEDAVVPTLDVAMQCMGELIRRGAGHPILMSGPSRTADIERVLTIGVHGPRSVVVVVVGSTTS